jgi:Uma2 family endonuclease
VGLVVEVSDSTLLGDRDDKGRIYGRAGIECYWIVNHQDGQIEVYTSPTGPVPDPGFGQWMDYRPGDLVPVLLGGVALAPVAVEDFLP